MHLAALGVMHNYIPRIRIADWGPSRRYFLFLLKHWRLWLSWKLWSIRPSLIWCNYLVWIWVIYLESGHIDCLLTRPWPITVILKFLRIFRHVHLGYPISGLMILLLRFRKEPLSDDSIIQVVIASIRPMNAILLMKLLDLVCWHCDELFAHWVIRIFVKNLEWLEIWTRLLLFLLYVLIYVLLTAVLTSLDGIRGLTCLLGPVIDFHHLVSSRSVSARVQGLMIRVVIDAESRLSLLSVAAVVTALLWFLILCLHPCSHPLMILLLLIIKAYFSSEDRVE